MNINYLFSVLNLYLSKENNNHIILDISRSNYYTFSLSMSDSSTDITKVIINDEDITIKLFEDLINKIKESSISIDDKYDCVSDNIITYHVTLNNGREIIFNNFTKEEINLFRNIIYHISIYDKDMKVKLDKDNDLSQIPYNLRLKQAGSTSLISIVLVLLWIVDIIFITLWIFKQFIK